MASTLQTFSWYMVTTHPHRKHYAHIKPRRRLSRAEKMFLPQTPYCLEQILPKSSATVSHRFFLESIIVSQNWYIGNKKAKKKKNGQLILNHHYFCFILRAPCFWSSKASTWYRRKLASRISGSFMHVSGWQPPFFIEMFSSTEFIIISLIGSPVKNFDFQITKE